MRGADRLESNSISPVLEIIDDFGIGMLPSVGPECDDFRSGEEMRNVGG